jgi:hypothetical protein
MKEKRKKNNVEKLQPSRPVGRNTQMCLLSKTAWTFLRKLNVALPYDHQFY